MDRKGVRYRWIEKLLRDLAASVRDRLSFEDFLALPAKQRDKIGNLVESLPEAARNQKQN